MTSYSYRVDYSIAPLESIWLYVSKEGNTFFAVPGKPYVECRATPWPPQVGRSLRISGFIVVPKRLVEVEFP